MASGRIGPTPWWAWPVRAGASSRRQRGQGRGTACHPSCSERRVGVELVCPASSSWPDLGLGKVADTPVGEADVNVLRAVPGQGFVRADGVVVDPVALGVDGQVEDVVDL